MHVQGHPDVNLHVKTRVLLCLMASQLWAEVPLLGLLKSVEVRYNAAKTMQTSFQQSLGGKGRITRTEQGELFLLRPGKMRWDYTTPAGKIFLVDGKNVYYYNPATRKAERSPVKESGDLRVPLAFLMGRLDFQRDFREFRTRTEGEITHVIAAPKSDKAPYTEVQFEVNRQAQILSVGVTGHDQSMMTFRFNGEKLGAPIAASKFEFVKPDGAELVEVDPR